MERGNLDLLLGKPILVELPKGTRTGKNFKGLYLKNYKLKDFLLNDNIGYDKYMNWVWSILMKPKDIGDILWVEHKVYYKDVNDWGLALQDVIASIEQGKDYSDTNLILALKFMFGNEFVFRIDPKGDSPETSFFLDVYDSVKSDRNWLMTINYDVFLAIRKVVKKVNYMKDNELNSWEYKYDKHEKKALKYYYEKRNANAKKSEDYEFSLETILYFLEAVSSLKIDDLMSRSLYGVNILYESIVNTYRAVSLNIGIYGGNVKVDSKVTSNLIYGAIHNTDYKKNLLSGNTAEGIKVENKIDK